MPARHPATGPTSRSPCRLCCRQCCRKRALMPAGASSCKGPTSGGSCLLLLLDAELPDAAHVFVMSAHASAASWHCRLACRRAATTAWTDPASSAVLHDVGLVSPSSQGVLACAQDQRQAHLSHTGAKTASLCSGSEQGALTSSSSWSTSRACCSLSRASNALTQSPSTLMRTSSEDSGSGSSMMLQI